MTDTQKARASRAKGVLVTRFSLPPSGPVNHVPMGQFGSVSVNNMTPDHVLEVTVRAIRFRPRKHRRTKAEL